MKGEGMRATRGLMLSALCGWILAASPAASHAQVYDAARRSLDFSADATARTPRLLGMGRLVLLSDVHNDVDLWDVAGDPIAVLEADTSSTFDVWPGTWSADGRHTPVGGSLEREHVAGREVRIGYEAMKRGENTAYGLYGDVSDLRSDRPFNDTRVVRDHADMPRVVGVLNGRMPYFQSQRMLYEVHAFYSAENTLDEYRRFYTNAAGEYLGKESAILAPPNFFDPDEFRVSTLGGGVGISYRVASWLKAVLGGDANSSRIEGENSDAIHNTGTGEDRPYYAYRLGLSGRVAGVIDYAAERRSWTSSSEERFVFTLKAGQNQSPFTGRGKVLDREEDGNEARARLRWNLGSLELNAGGMRWERNVDITPTVPGDRGSYNYFLDVAANRLGADSLAMPDSVRRTSSEEIGWEFGYGAAFRLPSGRGLIGAEYHFSKQTRTDAVFESQVPPSVLLSYDGQGPDRRISDVRAGLEYACSPSFTGRLGYIRRSDDRDELTDRNEFTSNTLTTGVGIHPAGSTWGLDVGWGIEWISPDFDDATDPKESRQQLGAQIRWVF
jgi:hypothetical protein